MIKIELKTHQRPQEPATPTISLPAINPIPEPQTARQGQAKPIITVDGRNLDSMDAAARDLYTRHPARYFDSEADEDAYWVETMSDYAAVARRFDNDPYIVDILVAKQYELECQVKFLRAQGKAGYAG